MKNFREKHVFVADGAFNFKTYFVQKVGKH